MHRTSEYGIAAHWKYKEGKSGLTTSSEQEKLSWLRQILDWQTSMSDNKEFMDTIKTDLNIYDDQVYAFTPQGDVLSLPAGSTPTLLNYMEGHDYAIGIDSDGKMYRQDIAEENSQRCRPYVFIRRFYFPVRHL